MTERKDRLHTPNNITVSRDVAQDERPAFLPTHCDLGTHPRGLDQRRCPENGP